MGMVFCAMDADLWGFIPAVGTPQQDPTEHREGCRDGEQAAHGQESHLPHLFSYSSALGASFPDCFAPSKVFWVRICPHPAGTGLLVALGCVWGSEIVAQDGPWGNHKVSHLSLLGDLLGSLRISGPPLSCP